MARTPSTTAIIEQAHAYLGTPYVYGGETPSGFDCSGFVQWLYAQQGISLPRVTYDQVNAGTEVKRSELRAGDVVFLEPDAKGPGHEALYIGNGKVIHAPHTGDVVRVASLDELAGRLGYVSARRIVPDGAPSLRTVTAAAPKGPAAAGKQTPLQVIQEYAPKLGLDPAAVAAYALTQGGLSWGAVGDNGSSFGPFQAHIGGAAGNRSSADASAWANSPAGLRQMMGMMARGWQGTRSGPEAAAFIVGPHFGRGADPASDEAKARAAYSQAATLVANGQPTEDTSTSAAVAAPEQPSYPAIVPPPTSAQALPGGGPQLPGSVTFTLDRRQVAQNWQTLANQYPTSRPVQQYAYLSGLGVDDQ